MVVQERARRAARRPARVQPARTSILRGTVQVFGELLITAGIILLLFVAWQLWWTNVESDARQSAVIKEFAQGLGDAASAEPSGADQEEPAEPVDYGRPVVGTAPGHAGTIGIMYIPRFGNKYTRPIVRGNQRRCPGHTGTGSLPHHGHAWRGG